MSLVNLYKNGVTLIIIEHSTICKKKSFENICALVLIENGD